jgi:hypothetical protein
MVIFLPYTVVEPVFGKLLIGQLTDDAGMIAFGGELIPGAIVATA